MQQSTIEFFCHDNEKSYEVQLEPECILFKVQPKITLKFVATFEDKFSWAVSVANNDIQLFPETLGKYEIAVYENDVPLEDLYKYMRL